MDKLTDVDPAFAGVPEPFGLVFTLMGRNADETNRTINQVQNAQEKEIENLRLTVSDYEEWTHILLRFITPHDLERAEDMMHEYRTQTRGW